MKIGFFIDLLKYVTFFAWKKEFCATCKYISILATLASWIFLFACLFIFVLFLRKWWLNDLGNTDIWLTDFLIVMFVTKNIRMYFKRLVTDMLYFHSWTSIFLFFSFINPLLILLLIYIYVILKCYIISLR